jgi:hypothetical protein
MSKEVKETVAKLWNPGLLFSEPGEEVVKDRSIDTLKRLFKKNPRAYAIQFFDRVSKKVCVDGKEQTVYGTAKNESPTFYANGTVHTVADVKKMKGDFRTLISNMEINDYKKVVKNKWGQFFPFREGKDAVIEI